MHSYLGAGTKAIQWRNNQGSSKKNKKKKRRKDVEDHMQEGK
jgi:hypothetical protein